MTDRRTLQVTTPSDLEVTLTRAFHAPRALVFDALTRPEMIRQWLGIHGTWQWMVCEVDLRVGGAYRYQWRNATGRALGMRGTYLEVAAPGRLVHTEHFDEPWYPGEGHVTTVLTEEEGWTTLRATVRAESREARDAILRSGMESGVAAAYDTLEGLLTQPQTSRTTDAPSL
jgi:uncharacterized protein YndB with AHSA1/START domain